MEKRLYKSPDKKICGLCAGLADYFNLDVTLARLIVVTVMLFTAVIPAALIYIIVSAILPDPPENYYQIFNNTSKKLYKSSGDKKVSGVIGGLSYYLGLKDPTIARILFVVAMFITGGFTLAIIYFVAASIMPEFDGQHTYYQQNEYTGQPQYDNAQYTQQSQPQYDNAQYTQQSQQYNDTYTTPSYAKSQQPSDEQPQGENQQ